MQRSISQLILTGGAICTAGILLSMTPMQDRMAAVRTAFAGPVASWPAPQLAEGAAFTEFAPLIRHRSLDAAKTALGAQLFADPALSASGQVSCQSCHDPAHGWGDGRQTSIGHMGMSGRRNAPALHTAAYRPLLFWDGRAATLQAQALGPLLDPIEMANPDLQSVLDRLTRNSAYDGLTADSMLEALEAFQRELETETRFDRFLAGDRSALGDAALRGLALFRGKAGCVNCHSGPLLTDEEFHNLGMGYFGRRYHDMGRYAVTGDPLDAARFRTPSLRHVATSAPYMHNGLIRDLRRVVIFYNSGGGRTRPRNTTEAADPVFQGSARTSDMMQRLHLSETEIADLVAFLEAL